MWVFLRFGFGDSVMEKIAFNDPYRFVVAIIPWHKDLVEKERLAWQTAWRFVTQQAHALPERRRNAEIVVRR